MRYPPLSIVWRCQVDVSTYVALGRHIEVGEQACPECGRRLGGPGGMTGLDRRAELCLTWSSV